MRAAHAFPFLAAPWFWISVGLHGAVLYCGSVLLVESAKYGVQQGISSLEVNLVAAPAASREASTIPEQDTMPDVPAVKPVVTPDDLTQPVAEAMKPKPKSMASLQPSALPPSPVTPKVTGTGASTSAGRDKITASSGGGARTIATPNYLNNPPPVYPEMARRQNMVGTVILHVEVSATGAAKSVEIEKSSGYSLLDVSAKQTVQRWRFYPGRIGGQPIDSTATVPIRFHLDGDRK
ncbi:MAG: hypothetical protein B9S32_00280 [Verrucomicrobia bacterium Tous-C9LFEB]|nr:MAG: hypothetical protein B9S32_00280 [Verrucomicrobia bacterium Tous-C9LFEB]